MSNPWAPTRPVFACLFLALALIAAACAPEAPEVQDTADIADAPDPAGTPDAAAGGSCAGQPYTVNPDAAQDLIENTTGFLRCTAGDYALCYYSGADPLPCTVDEADGSASCQCQIFTASDDQPMYVLMTSILNLCAFTEAVEQCGEDGSACFNICNDFPHAPQCKDVTLPANQVQATVCDYVADGTFNPDAAYISTFSFAKVDAPGSDETFAIACNATEGQYAGCMTAPCSGETTEDNGNRYTSCACPLWPADGSPVDYQFGRRCGPRSTGNCELGANQVWSAAYNPDGCPALPSAGPPEG